MSDTELTPPAEPARILDADAKAVCDAALIVGRETPKRMYEAIAGCMTQCANSRIDRAVAAARVLGTSPSPDLFGIIDQMESAAPVAVYVDLAKK